MKRFLTTLLATGSLWLAGASASHGITLVSSALDASQTDQTTGSNGGGIFSGTPGGDASTAVAGVTTTVLTDAPVLGGKFGGGTTGPQTITLRAVSLVDGMDLTYDVTYSPFRFNGTTDVATSTRRGGYVAVSSANNNDEREQTTSNADGVEFWRVVIDNIVNSGSTLYQLDGAVAVRINALSGMVISDTYINGVLGNTLGSGGVNPALVTDTDILFSSPAPSFAIVATADDTTGTRANFDNRWEGLAVQFSSVQASTSAVPEPASLALGLMGLGGLCLRRRRMA